MNILVEFKVVRNNRFAFSRSITAVKFVFYIRLNFIEIKYRITVKTRIIFFSFSKSV